MNSTCETPKYVKQEIIDSGTYARVYKVRNLVNNQDYACKLEPLNELAPDMLREIMTLSILNSPSIISYREVVVTDKYIGIIMPLCQGTLQGLDPVNSEMADRIALQLLIALAEMRSKGIVHRDIKPNNILYNRNGDQIDILLADFGLAKLHSEYLPFSHSNYGFNYQAPELLIGQRKYGFEIDVWATGIVLLGLFTNYKLMMGTNPISNYLHLMKCFTKPSEKLKIIQDCEYVQLLCRHPNLMKHFVEVKSSNVLKHLSLNPRQYRLLRSMLRFLPSKRASPAELLEQFYNYEVPLQIFPVTYQFKPIKNLVPYNYLYSFAFGTDNSWPLESALVLLNHYASSYPDKFSDSLNCKKYALCIYNLTSKLYNSTSLSLESLCKKHSVNLDSISTLELEILSNTPNCLLNNSSYIAAQLTRDSTIDYDVHFTVNLLILSSQASSYTLYELVSTVLYYQTGSSNYQASFGQEKIFSALNFFGSQIKALSSCAAYYKYAKLCQFGLL